MVWKSREKRISYLREWNKLPRSKMIMRRSHLKRKFGMTLEDYDNMYDAQDGCCAICGRDEIELVIDHCHKTQQVRALLCNYCNSILGFFERHPELVPRFPEYIKYYAENT